jgi:ribonuclease HII
MAPFNTSALYEFDRGCEKANVRVVGIDEAGRGPLAGPVVAAAVVLDLREPIEGIFDSKQVSPKNRERLFDAICSKASAWGIGEASPEEIDTINILQATFLAMRRALDKVTHPWTLALIDGNQFLPSVSRAVQKPIVKGDGLSASIAAASILAKVWRDRIMEEHHRRLPQWDFAAHKGYATQRHRDLIVAHGMSAIHRKSFCRNIVETVSEASMQTCLDFSDAALGTTPSFSSATLGKA